MSVILLISVYLLMCVANATVTIISPEKSKVATRCTVGMTVEECRQTMHKDDRFFALTALFCRENGTELKEDDRLTSMTYYNDKTFMVCDLTFRQPAKYSLAACAGTTRVEVGERLGAFLGQPVLVSTIKNSEVIVHPEKSILLSINGRHVAVPADRPINTFEVPKPPPTILCNSAGSELSELVSFKTSTECIQPQFVSIKLSVHGLSWNDDHIPACQLTTAAQLRYRLTRHYGSVDKMYCNGVACKDSDLVRHNTVEIVFKSVKCMQSHLDTEYGTNVGKCRMCRMSIAVAAIMFMNAVLAVAAALYYRHLMSRG